MSDDRASGNEPAESKDQIVHPVLSILSPFEHPDLYHHFSPEGSLLVAAAEVTEGIVVKSPVSSVGGDIIMFVRRNTLDVLIGMVCIVEVDLVQQGHFALLDTPNLEAVLMKPLERHLKVVKWSTTGGEKTLDNVYCDCVKDAMEFAM